MGTKIYNGIKFKTNKFYEIYEKLNDFYETYDAFYKERTDNYVAYLFFHKLDRILLDKKEDIIDKKQFLTNIFNETMNEYNVEYEKFLKEDYRNTLLDKSLVIRIYVYKKDIYGFVGGENDRIIDKFKEFCDVEDFSYWNNTDKPDEITQEEWDKRENIWEKLYKVAKSDLENISIIYNYDNKHYIPKLDDMFNNNNLSKRIEELVELDYINKEFQNNESDKKNMFSLFLKIRSSLKERLKKDSEFKKEFENKIYDLENSLNEAYKKLLQVEEQQITNNSL